MIVDQVRRSGLQGVLEVGCGSGQLAGYLREQGGIQSHIGVDFSQRAVELARQVAPQGTFIVGDALDPGRTNETSIASSAPRCWSITEDLRAVELFPSGTRCLGTVPVFPYPSHVRHFLPTAVAERHGSVFRDFDVTVFKATRHKTNPVLRYFLLDGVRV